MTTCDFQRKRPLYVAKRKRSSPLILLNSSLEMQIKSIRNFKQYILSHDFVELLLYAISVSIPLVCVASLMPVHEHNIPYQELDVDDNGINVVINLTYNLRELSSIFSDAALVVVIILAYFLQLILSLTIGSRGDGHRTSCVHILAVGINLFVTEIMKRYVGYFRPHFYNSCQFNTDTLACDNEVEDARKSFPSGHASTSFCSMALITLYLRRRFGISTTIHDFQLKRCSTNSNPMDISGHSSQRGDTLVDEHDTVKVQYKFKMPTRTQKAISVLCLSPMVLSYIIAGSRVVDNHHHPADIVCGAVLGTSLAMYFDGIWFHPVVFL
mmetsp:Transcript_2970/g.4163  ORF Transcript_2970/g.4163 Transcript_2970/m.4163 type:complete len:326 (+) Transcript_2970:62-1039(+)